MVQAAVVVVGVDDVDVEWSQRSCRRVVFHNGRWAVNVVGRNKNVFHAGHVAVAPVAAGTENVHFMQDVPKPERVARPPAKEEGSVGSCGKTEK